MKAAIFLLSFLLLSQIVICQNRSIKIEQLVITNNLNGKSVKLLTNEETLKNFGELITINALDQNIHSEDYAKEYVFADIKFYTSTLGKIASFETESENIIIEKKGYFSISPGILFLDLSKLFPYETQNAKLIHYGPNNEEFLCVKLNLSDFSQNLNKYVDIDYSLNLLFDVKTEILVKAYIWIKP